jgi:hypothetical protein
MATDKQIQSNRNNAQASSGPRTEEGKARVSQNALKHGLLARDAVLPGEDPAEFEAQLAALEADIQPGDALERELVRQIADAQWRMRRLVRLETGYLAAALDETRRFTAKCRPSELQPGYEGETLLLGTALLNRTQALVHLARYDGHLGRRFDRAIRQIAQLRDAREKRRAADANSALHRPADPVYARIPRPANGAAASATAQPSGYPAPSIQASEKEYGTKPISSKPHGINGMAEAASRLENEIAEFEGYNLDDRNGPHAARGPMTPIPAGGQAPEGNTAR